MWTSRSDMKNTEPNDSIVFWIAIVGILIGTYLAIVVYAP
jgi:hypothetical protein